MFKKTNKLAVVLFVLMALTGCTYKNGVLMGGPNADGLTREITEETFTVATPYGKAVVNMTHTFTMPGSLLTSNPMKNEGAASIDYYDAAGKKIGSEILTTDFRWKDDFKSDIIKHVLAWSPKPDTKKVKTRFEELLDLKTKAIAGCGAAGEADAFDVETCKSEQTDHYNAMLQKELEGKITTEQLDQCMSAEKLAGCMDPSGPLYKQLWKQEMDVIQSTIPGAGTTAGCTVQYDHINHVYVCI